MRFVSSVYWATSCSELSLKLQYVGLNVKYAFIHAVRMRSVHLELISLNVLAQVARGVDKLSTSFQTIIASFPDCIPCLTFVSLCLARWFCFFFCCKRSSHAATCSVLFSSFSHGFVTHVIRQRHSHHPLTHSRHFSVGVRVYIERK